jgi:hypothetical protein
MEKTLWTTRRVGVNYRSMRAARILSLLAVLSALSGCACLPGGGKATNALDALKQPSSTFSRQDAISSNRF